MDIGAPGVDLVSLSAGGNGFVSASGTSFATAVASGVAALVRARFPRLTGPQVVARIEGSALSPTGTRDERTGAGIIDTYRALSDIGPTLADPAGADPGPGAGAAVRVLPSRRSRRCVGPRTTATVVMGILLAAAAVAALFGLADGGSRPAAAAARRPPSAPSTPSRTTTCWPLSGRWAIGPTSLDRWPIGRGEHV